MPGSDVLGSDVPGASCRSALPSAVVLDLDGVLADTRHRMAHLLRRPTDWEAFFAAAARDPAHPEGLAVARESAARGHHVVYLSGRPERTRPDTERWLAQVGAPDGEVVLRRDGDRRAAPAVKLGALRALAGRFRLLVLVDDDPAVVRAARRSGTVAEVVLAGWQPRDEVTDQAQRDGRT